MNTQKQTETINKLKNLKGNTAQFEVEKLIAEKTKKPVNK